MEFFLIDTVCVLNHSSHVPLFVTPWTIAHQVPLSIGFSKQEYRNGLSCPPPGNLPNPGIEPVSLKSPALVKAGSLPLVPVFFFFLIDTESRKEVASSCRVGEIEVSKRALTLIL